MSDPQSAVLVALLRGPSRGMTVTQLRLATAAGGSTIRSNLAVMGRQSRYGEPWVQVVAEQPRTWKLTERGREVARYRARQPGFRRAADPR